MGSALCVVALLLASICYFIITRLMFFFKYSLYVRLLCFVGLLFFILCILCFCFVLSIVSPSVSFLFFYKFTEHCYWVEIYVQ